MYSQRGIVGNALNQALERRGKERGVCFSTLGILTAQKATQAAGLRRMLNMAGTE